MLSWLLVKGAGSDVCDEGPTRIAEEMHYSPLSDQPELDYLEQEAMPEVLIAMNTCTMLKQ